MKKIKRTIKFYWPLYVMLLPGVVYLICFRYLPMFGTVIAFKDINYVDGIWRSPWVGFENFKFLFKSSDAWVITRNTIGYNAVFIVLKMAVAVTFAIMLSELRNRKAAKFYQSIMFLPYFLSMVVIGYVGFAFLGSEHGFINNQILTNLGMDKIRFYTETKFWPVILTLIHVWKWVGYSTIIYLAAILGISPDIYEAATIDGANKWNQIRFITIPQIKPVMITLGIMAVGRIFYSDFGLFYNVPMNSGPLFKVTQTIDTYVYRALIYSGDVGMSAAAAFYQSCVGFLLVLAANAFIRRVDKDNALF